MSVVHETPQEGDATAIQDE
jgi:hypothetical protein